MLKRVESRWKAIINIWNRDCFEGISGRWKGSSRSHEQTFFSPRRQQKLLNYSAVGARPVWHRRDLCVFIESSAASRKMMKTFRSLETEVFLINFWIFKINAEICSSPNICSVPPMLWVSVIYFCIIFLRSRSRTRSVERNKFYANSILLSIPSDPPSARRRSFELQRDTGVLHWSLSDESQLLDERGRTHDSWQQEVSVSESRLVKLAAPFALKAESRNFISTKSSRSLIQPSPPTSRHTQHPRQIKLKIFSWKCCSPLRQAIYIWLALWWNVPEVSTPRSSSKRVSWSKRQI